MSARANHLSATQTDQDHRVGVPGPPEPAETVSGPSETLDRDVTVMLRRRIRHTPPATLAEQVTADPERTLGKLATLVADELRRTGQAAEAPRQETLLDRLRPLTPNGERVLGWAGGTLALGLLLAMIVLLVGQVTT